MGLRTREDRRKYPRLPGFLEGHFQAEEVSGLVMLRDFTREGVGASLNRGLAPGTRVALDIAFPGSTVPIEARGRIVWQSPGKGEWTYPFDAGIRLEEIEPGDSSRMMDHAFKHWCRQQESGTPTPDEG
jgi:hypothetical protein